MSALPVFLVTIYIFALQRSTSLQSYPELQPQLEIFQNCYPDRGIWFMVKRNYPYDPFHGGSARCVKYERIGPVIGNSMNVRYSWCQDGSGRGYGSSVGRHVLTNTPGYRAGNLYNFFSFKGAGTLQFLTVFKDCHTCFIGRYFHALNGYGCAMWRRVSSFNRRAQYCDFIFHLFCGGTPSYQMYDDSCGRVLGLNGTSNIGWQEN
ncbi:uncharacterized protein LOC142564763 [Dermacentor variabilis]|uniref:uncharacterized protein LOC142564763 n=1 Tax=Dermacentor variabilis TaxID=34621 RepID=UPI003F5B6F47